jgi:hypothetical protein
MKAPWSIVGYAAVAVVIGLCVPARSKDGSSDEEIAKAVAGITTRVDDGSQVLVPGVRQQVELGHALSALDDPDASAEGKGRGVRCYYNCPPPVGSATASPQVVNVPGGALGSTTIHWRWDQSEAEAVTRHSCLWVSGSKESEAYLVQCGRPGHTYATALAWIRAGNYVFRVAPGNPKGPYTKPVAGLFQLAQTIVVGVPR